MKTQSAFIISFCIFCLLDSLHAQVTFQKTYGDVGSSSIHSSFVTTTADGGFAVVGYTSGLGAGNDDIYLVRTNNNGDVLWTKTYGGANVDRPNAIRQTNDGGFIIVGFTNSFGAGQSDVLLIRTDANGDTLWTKTYGKETNEEGWDVDQTNDNGFIVAADWGSSSYTYLIRTDANGDIVWTKVYDTGRAFSVHHKINGNFVVGGGVYSFGTNGQDNFLLTTDSSGNILSYNSYGTAGTEYNGRVISTSDGGNLMYGSSLSMGSHAIPYIIKTDSNALVVWSKVYAQGSFDMLCSSAFETNDGYVLLASTSMGPDYIMTLIKIDPSGNLLWSNNLTSGFAGTIAQTLDGGFIFSSGPDDCVLTKTNSIGQTSCAGTAVTITDSVVTTLVFPFNASELSGTSVSVPVLQINNNLGSSITVCTDVGVHDLKGENDMVISPNPFTTSFILSTTKAFGVATISDMRGRKIMTLQTSDDKTKVDAQLLAPGIYLINYHEPNKDVNLKLVKL